MHALFPMDMRSRRGPYDGGNCFATARIALAPRGAARALAVRDVRRQAELLRLSPGPRAEWRLTRAPVRPPARRPPSLSHRPSLNHELCR